MKRVEDPWAGLMAGGVDARRVDPSGRHDYFWVRSAKGEPGLLLRLQPDTEQIRPLANMKNIDLAYREIGNSDTLLLLLRDSEQQSLFANLCYDIIDAGEAALSNQEALQRSLRRMLRWHHLLRGGRQNVLSLEEQRGLLGELQFLARLVARIGPRASIEAWRGPMGSAKDFELDGSLVEVKARRGAAKPFVQISSEDQLTEVTDCKLYLVVSAIDAAVKPGGQNLTDHVRAIDRIFEEADSVSYSLWEDALSATGFDFSDDYSDRHWVLGKWVDYEVRDDFPRISTPLLHGVSAVRYSISLDACSPFQLPDGNLETLLMGGVGR